MDTIALLLILYAVYKRFQKKKDGAKKPRKPVENRSSQMRAERAARIHEELQRIKAEKQISTDEAVAASTFAEGGATAAPITMEGESVQESRMEYRGSMNADSFEGECICDPELEHERAAMADPACVYAGEIGRAPALDLSSAGIYQGIVMSEILTRPAQRIRRR